MKTASKFFGVLAVLIGGLSYLHAANTCAPTDTMCYQSGPYQNPNTTFRVDASGNVTSNGTGTNSFIVGSKTVQAGITIFTPVLVTGVSSTTIITPTSTFITVVSTGGQVTCGGTFATPCISTAAATNGQYLIIGSTSTPSAVIFTSGTASGMDLGSATRLVDENNKLAVIYDSFAGQWREVSFGSN